LQKRFLVFVSGIIFGTFYFGCHALCTVIGLVWFVVIGLVWFVVIYVMLQANFSFLFLVSCFGAVFGFLLLYMR
jgi:hypothetical protein